MVEAGRQRRRDRAGHFPRRWAVADKRSASACRTVSHLQRAGGRAARRRPVAQRCAPDIPLDTAAGWRRPGAPRGKRTRTLPSLEAPARRRASTARPLLSERAGSSLRDVLAEQAASALEPFNAPTMAGTDEIPPAKSETARIDAASSSQDQVQLRSVSDVDRPLDRRRRDRFGARLDHPDAAEGATAPAPKRKPIGELGPRRPHAMRSRAAARREREEALRRSNASPACRTRSRSQRCESTTMGRTTLAARGLGLRGSLLSEAQGARRRSVALGAVDASRARAALVVRLISDRQGPRCRLIARHEGGEVAEGALWSRGSPDALANPSHTPNRGPQRHRLRSSSSISEASATCQLCLADEDGVLAGARIRPPGLRLCRQIALGPQEKAGSKAKMTWRRAGDREAGTANRLPQRASEVDRGQASRQEGRMVPTSILGEALPLSPSAAGALT